jgi:UDP-N-acetylmuramoylalanine--D-glutamate ligase
MNEFQGKKVVIIGAARQGLALARFLDKQGALVTLTDQQPAEKLADGLKTLTHSNVKLSLGGHPFDILEDADVVCVSGGVPLTLPFILEAQRREIPLTNDSEIFMRSVIAPVTAITGSAGKTTTTTLVGRMAAAAAAADDRKTWVGGNIGNPLIESVTQIKTNDLVVLELSSFQLELMTTSPHVAAVLNITPNHLDRHDSIEAYTDAKARILRFQCSDDIAVLNQDDQGSWNLRDSVRGRLISFSRRQSSSTDLAMYLADGQVVYRDGNTITPLLDESLIELRGNHNLMNVIAACAIAVAMELPVKAIQAGVIGFRGVAHRLELVREWKGIRWVNGSIATAPERTLADLHSFEEPIVLLLGGRDKNLPWEELASYIHTRVDHVIVFGEAAPKISAALGQPGKGEQLASIDNAGSFTEALEIAAGIASPGDIVLLSPGCTSYDAFRDFEERGEFFRKWVNNLV